MSAPNREQAEAMLESVRKDHGGFRMGLTPSESEDVLEAYLSLLGKFERVVSCR